MPTRKQRKRIQKGRRHDYETVWVDGDGNELDEPPEDAPASARERRSEDGKKSQQKNRPQRPQRPSRSTRIPLEPSWRRAARRALILGVIVVVFMYLVNTKATPGARIASAAELGVIYALLFTPFTYYLDRFTYRRWERNTGGGKPKKR